MSNVLARKRSISELEFWRTAEEIQTHLTRYLMNEKHVPKRWKFVFAEPGIAYTRKLMDEIVAANTIYPTSDEELAQRRAHQNEAIVVCEQLLQHLHHLIRTFNKNVNDFETIVGLLTKEAALLRAWKKKNKVMTQKYKE